MLSQRFTRFYRNLHGFRLEGLIAIHSSQGFMRSLKGRIRYCRDLIISLRRQNRGFTRL